MTILCFQYGISPEESRNYSEEQISQCIQAVESGMTVYSGCKQYGIPMSTVIYRMSGRWTNKYKPGPQTVLTTEEEKRIVKWLNDMQDRGFPVSRHALLFKVNEYLLSNPRDTPFRDNRPGRKWTAGFMKRNPGLSFRTPEAVSQASGRVSEIDIRGWFDMVDNWLTTEQIRDILDDPTRVYNGDETSFLLHPKSKEVIARTGSRNVYEVEQAAGKQNITVMFSFGASGAIVHPHVILPGKRIRKEIAQGFPPEWGIGQSDKGWMDSPNFRDYIVQIFHPFLIKQRVQFPVIYFVDGHSSHKALEVADVCQALGIVLIALYPNTTHITQPADVAVFKPLKSEWKRAVEEWRFQNQGCALTVPHFGSVLSKAIERGITSKTIQNGFRVCGLYPFDPNSVDYSKCLARAASTVSAPTLVDIPVANFSELSTEQNSCAVQTVNISIDRIIEAYDLIGTELVTKMNGDVNQLTREERIIRYFYREFVRPHVNFHNHSSSAIQLDLDVANDLGDENTVCPSSADIDINYCEIVNFEDMNANYSNLPLVVKMNSSRPNEDYLEEDNDMANNANSNESNLSSELAASEAVDLVTPCNSGSIWVSNDLEVSDAKLAYSPVNSADALIEVTNTQTVERRRLSEVLKLPPTPHRSTKHRNYTTLYQPVLTAGARLAEINKKKKEKAEKEQLRKRKAVDRLNAKTKREEAKKAKMEERERKKELQKNKKSNLKSCNKRAQML